MRDVHDTQTFVLVRAIVKEVLRISEGSAIVRQLSFVLVIADPQYVINKPPSFLSAQSVS